MNAAERLLQVTQLQLQTEHAIARRQYEIRREQVLLRYRPIRDRAVEIAEIGRAAYREGGTDLLRLLDSERLRTETQLAYVRMLRSYHQSVIELERAGGIEP